jgi:uncharacterized protein with LGFP repeats
MTGQQRTSGQWLSRATVGLLAAASLIVSAPYAAASPDSDADSAITQAWESDGGSSGVLGSKDGTVYAVGDGFGQNFSNGKMFFTPATGAHYIVGAILEKYEALGGPANSDLGFPTADEGTGKVSSDSRDSTFSASDKPVIFYMPDSGAHVVRGAINLAWDKLGGSAGTLGVPSEDESYQGDVVSQQFTGGQVSWNRQTKEFTTVPPELAAQLTAVQVPADPTSAIEAARRAAGGPTGPLGARKGPARPVGADGMVQEYADGKIFYSPATGANVLRGAILAKYETAGGPTGDLGFPASSETDGGLAPLSRMATFAAPDKPAIFWTPDFGPVIVRGAMSAAWAKLGGPTGQLGVPTTDQSANGDVLTQKFTGGEISWDRAKNSFATNPANLATSLVGLSVPGQQSPSVAAPINVPAAPAKTAGPGNGAGMQWHWWSWAIIAAAATLLLALVALLGASFRWRRQRHRKVAAALPDSHEPDDWSSDVGDEDHRLTPLATDDDDELTSYQSYASAWADHRHQPEPANWEDAATEAFSPGGEAAPGADDEADRVADREEGEAAPGQLAGDAGEAAAESEGEPAGEAAVDSAGEVSGEPAHELTGEVTGEVGGKGPGEAVEEVPAEVGGDERHADHQAAEAGEVAVTGTGAATAVVAGAATAAVVGAATGAAAHEKATEQADDTPGELAIGEDELSQGALADAASHAVAEADHPAPEPEHAAPEADLGAAFADHTASDSGVAVTEESRHEVPSHTPWGAGFTEPVVSDAHPDEPGDAGFRTFHGYGAEADISRHETPAPAPRWKVAPKPTGGVDRNAQPSAKADEDAADTTPNRIVSASPDRAGRHAAAADDDALPSRPAMHLPLDDPHQAPPGYPVKASMYTGEYHTPNSAQYENVVAEIWFASEELARANGFRKGS